jgi:hypothetical protein
MMTIREWNARDLGHHIALSDVLHRVDVGYFDITLFLVRNSRIAM